LGLVGPWIAPYDPLAIDLLHEYEPPSRAHLLGTGDNGIDILSFRPRFARRYLELAEEIQGAVRDYCNDVREGSFPDQNESY